MPRLISVTLKLQQNFLIIAVATSDNDNLWDWFQYLEASEWTKKHKEMVQTRVRNKEEIHIQILPSKPIVSLIILEMEVKWESTHLGREMCYNFWL